MHGLLSNKNIRIPLKIKFRDPLAPKKANFGRTKAEVGCFSQKGLCYSFEMWRLLSNKNIRIPMRKKYSGTPLAPPPPKKMLLGGQKPKLAVSPRRVCATVLEFCMGS